jgi:nucleoside-diphosphate-sugar epimerase
MMYMPDAIRATIEIMEAPAENIRIRGGYNLAAMSFSPEEIARVVEKHCPGFRMTYKPDFRQQIADSWPKSIDDHEAREHWGWRHEFDLEKMSTDMFMNLKKLLVKN